MWLWITIAVVVVALGAWAYRPSRRGVNDVEARRRQLASQSDVEQFRPKNSGIGPAAG